MKQVLFFSLLVIFSLTLGLSKAGDKIKVMWDALGSDKSSAPDKKRLITKDLPVEIGKTHSKYNDLEHDNKKFGWPVLKWGRMPERGNNNMEI